MTGTARIEVQADGVVALGEAMSHVADDLAWQASALADSTWALGRGHSAAALGEVLGDFEHQRLVLGRLLADLGQAARGAGSLYVEVEQQVGGMVDHGGAS